MDNEDESSLVIRRATNLSEDLVNEEGQDAEEDAYLDCMDLYTKSTRGTRKKCEYDGNGLSVTRRSARIEKLNKRAK